MQGISRSDLQAMLGQLEQAIQNHLKWHESLARILVCRLPFDPAMAAPDAHRHCAFGNWYYNDAPDKMRGHPAFIAIELQHKAMHDLASRLLRESAAGETIAADDYDRFSQGIGEFRLELETLRRELETALGNLDPLTGAHNRIGMLTWLRTQHELVRRGILSCTIAMIDLDHFKEINDSHGHPAGDAVLAGASRYLLEHIRPYDKLFRYGGDEFLLCIQGVDAGASHAMIDRLRSGLAESPIAVETGTFPCRISCGVAAVIAEASVETAIQRADKALYVAKSSGRNQTLTWDESMS